MRPKLELVGKKPSKRFLERVHGNIYRRPGIKNFYVVVRFGKQRIPRLFKSLGTDRLPLAKSLAAEAIHNHLKQWGAEPSSNTRVGKPVREVIDEVLEFKAPKRRARTREYYGLYLKVLRKEWGSWDIRRVTPEAWSRWLIDFRQGQTRKTYKDYAKFMNIVLKYAYEKRYLSHRVKVEHGDVDSKTGRVFTREEAQALFNAMNQDTKDQFILCIESFMRLREALYLTWDRVDLKDGTVVLRAEDVKTGSRTGRGRTFKMSPRALDMMRVRRERMKVDSPYVFPSKSADKPIDDNKTAWNAAKRRAGIQGRARWHDLRHTALSWALLEKKENPVLVSEYAGVSMRTIQRVYLHSTAEKTAAISHAVSIFDERASQTRRKVKRG